MRLRKAILTIAAGALAATPFPAQATHNEPSNLCYDNQSDVHGTDGADRFIDSANHHLDAVLAAGNDYVEGRDNVDYLCGQADQDELYGQDGDDRLNGGQGADKLFGGPGADILNGGDGTNDVCTGGGGNDSFSGCETIN